MRGRLLFDQHGRSPATSSTSHPPAHLRKSSVVRATLRLMTDDDVWAPEPVEVIETYVEAHDRPIAGGRWEVLADDSVRYVRQSGQVVHPAVVPVSTLRDSPSW